MTQNNAQGLYETSLQEIYGDNYVNDFIEHNRRYVADLVISNIAGLNFREVKHDYAVLFGDSNELPEKWFRHIQENVHKLRSELILRRITNPQREVPRLLDEPQITYIKVFDLLRKNIYILFITPYILDAL